MVRENGGGGGGGGGSPSRRPTLTAASVIGSVPGATLPRTARTPSSHRRSMASFPSRQAAAIILFSQTYFLQDVRGFVSAEESKSLPRNVARQLNAVIRQSRAGQVPEAPSNGTGADESLKTPQAAQAPTLVICEPPTTGEVAENCEPSTSETAESSQLLTTVPARLLALTHRARRVRFYRNGDQFFKGIWFAVSAEKLRTWDVLLEELTRLLADSASLPHGVRHVFSLDGAQKLQRVDELREGHAYVCASTDAYRRLDYLAVREPQWRLTLAPRRLHPQDAAQMALSNVHFPKESQDVVYPRIITVIRNGVKPRRLIRHLLNHKTARSFPQVLQDITPLVRLDSGAVRRLYTLSGRPVVCLADLFAPDDVFIAYGTERTHDDDFCVAHDEQKRLCGATSSNATGRPRGSAIRRQFPKRNESLRGSSRCPSLAPSEPSLVELPLLLADRLKVIRLLGDGNSAIVYEVASRDGSSENSALKIVSKETAADKAELLAAEIELMASVRHPHLVRLLDHHTFDGAHYMRLELVTGGDLFEYLCVRRTLDEQPAARLVKCLADALTYLHAQAVVHRDVKPENLLLYGPEDALQLKLADFGLAVRLPEDGQKLMTICGTPTYVAAEVLAEMGYAEKVDTWATGVILYVMMCGFPPFHCPSNSQERLFAAILRGRFDFPSPAWDGVSFAARALCLSLINIDVEERLSAADLLAHDWVVGEGRVDPNFEAIAEMAVEERLGGCADAEYADQESSREFYMSRRASMDEWASGTASPPPQFTPRASFEFKRGTREEEEEEE